jgi:hypothetical protein
MVKPALTSSEIAGEGEKVPGRIMESLEITVLETSEKSR